jgi:CheY-like chemotaxis protein
MDARDRAVPTADVTTERQPRILVIDDDRYVRLLLCDLLSTWGYEADVASDGSEGLALFVRGSYDAVLTDLAMPQVSGLDVAAGIRLVDPAVAVILFTAVMGEVRENERLGVTVLRKPVDIDDLRRALRDTLTGPASA